MKEFIFGFLVIFSILSGFISTILFIAILILNGLSGQLPHNCILFFLILAITCLISRIILFTVLKTEMETN